MQEGTTIEEEDNAKIIYASEFGDRVMDYVNEIYKDKQTMTDSTGINSYVYTTEKKETTENSCKLVTTLSINLDADFSKINEYSNQLSAEVLNKDITEENADYVIRLKVGQKCNIKSEKKIVGYETYGSNCIEFNEEKNVMTAVGTGIANGYLYVGDNTNKKSFYVIVEENASNQILEPVNITISNTSNNNNPNANKNVKTTVPKTTLPKAGNSKILFALLFIAAIVLAIILGAKNRKFKDIK